MDTIHPIKLFLQVQNPVGFSTLAFYLGFIFCLSVSFLRMALWGRWKKIACDALMICKIGSLMSSFVIISIGFHHAGQFQG